jgi:hypothetical protein
MGRGGGKGQGGGVIRLLEHLRATSPAGQRTANEVSVGSRPLKGRGSILPEGNLLIEEPQVAFPRRRGSKLLRQGQEHHLDRGRHLTGRGSKLLSNHGHRQLRVIESRVLSCGCRGVIADHEIACALVHTLSGVRSSAGAILNSANRLPNSGIDFRPMNSKA